MLPSWYLLRSLPGHPDYEIQGSGLVPLRADPFDALRAVAWTTNSVTDSFGRQLDFEMALDPHPAVLGVSVDGKILTLRAMGFKAAAWQIRRLT